MATDDVSAARHEAVAAAMDDIRRIETDLGVTREGVAAIRDRLIELSSRRELFPPDHFPAPPADGALTSYMYRLAQDDDDRFALYAQSSRGDLETPAHDHATWVVVVGHSGTELNKFYERTDDGIAETGQHMVRAGTGVAMLPDELHSIHIDEPALNFHCYGLALERLDRRHYYSPTYEQWRAFSRVSGVREGRPDRAG